MWNPKSLLLLAMVPTSLLSTAALGQVSADDFPSRPVVIIVPSDGTGTVDTETRLFAQSVAEKTGRTFLVENKGGAAMIIGTNYVAKARPDGYTLLSANGAFAITPSIYPDIPYDNIRDFAPITLLDKHMYVLLVHPSAPFRTVGDYIAYAKRNPDELNFSTTGVGGVAHLAGALLHYMTNTKVTFVHYKAPSQRLVDLMSGRVNASVTAPLSAMPLMKSGKLRGIGITSDQRISLLPDLPTIAEQGVPGYEYGGWVGLVAPARTPVAIINRLNAMFVQSVKDPNVIRKLETDGTIMVGGTPEQFRQHIATETDRWRKLIRATNMKVELD